MLLGLRGVRRVAPGSVQRVMTTLLDRAEARSSAPWLADLTLPPEPPRTPPVHRLRRGARPCPSDISDPGPRTVLVRSGDDIRVWGQRLAVHQPGEMGRTGAGPRGERVLRPRRRSRRSRRPPPLGGRR